ncbi:MAG: 2-succinyl-5-enolpyruvyl-6-hydroxy-3-cyclohexene-1-carboxylic-acid synthase [Eggerthellaceae bacterium]
MADVWDGAVEPLQVQKEALTPGQELALYVSAFFDELRRCGVREVVVCPGSRSTPLSIVAYKSPMNVFVDVDERGAAFLALGMAKAYGRPVAVICTSGTAVGNMLPAVMEAQSSRVPLIILSGNRPPVLQGVGAPQTCDQQKIFGDYVSLYRQMPLPSADERTIAYARQMAMEATSAAAGAHDSSFGANGGSLVDAGPVHLDFPFDEPLNPDLSAPGLFKLGARGRTDKDLPGRIGAWSALGPHRAADILRYLEGKRVAVVCGERTIAGGGQVEELLKWATHMNYPLLADPLSRLRVFDESVVIDNYDSILATDDIPAVDVLIRFGRWPVSKRLTTWVQKTNPVQIVVDPRETRDFTCSTDIFVRTTPIGFVSALAQAEKSLKRTGEGKGAQAACLHEWDEANRRALGRIMKVGTLNEGFEGVFIQETIRQLPEGSLLFCGNSMTIRGVDTFYTKREKPLAVLCNRGLNGIDGTLSTAIGAAQAFPQTAVLVGDLSFLHDLNALALQGEMLIRQQEGYVMPSIVVVCLNNGGGAIFDMLPQKTEDPYYARLFYTPQQMKVSGAAETFGLPYRQAATRQEYVAAWEDLRGVPGLSVIEVTLPLQGVKDRFAPYWG